MTESAAKVEELTKHLDWQKAQLTELLKQQEALKQGMRETDALLGVATAKHYVEAGLAVTERDLRKWFSSANGPAPESVLLALMDSNQVQVVYDYLLSIYNSNYTKNFYIRVLRETNNFVELGKNIGRNEAVFESAYNELFEELVLRTDLGEQKLRVPDEPLSMEVILKLAKAHYNNVESFCQDFEVLKKLVAVNTRVMHNVKSEVTGRVLKMRELVAINPKCAYFASPPITVNAGVDSRDKPEVKMKKVYDWLTITGEKKLFAKEVKVEPQQAPTPPKKPFKL